MDNMIAYNGCLDCQGRVDQGPLPLRDPLRRWGARKVLGRDWPHDAMRHSYASYHFAMYRDGGLTPKNLGHPSPTLLRKDYNNAVTRAEAEEFWSIAPGG